MSSQSFIKKPFQQKSSFFICDILEKGSSTNNNRHQCVSPALSETSIDSDRCFSPTNTSSPDLSFDRSGSKPLAASTPSSLSKKARKARTIFTDKQLQSLEDCFDKQKYLSVQDRMDLANKLNLSDTQVKTWYQNRRTKWKRQSSVGYELLTEANNCAAVQQMLMGGHPYWSAFLKTYLHNTTTTPPMFRVFPPSAENQFPTVTLPTSSSSNLPGFPSVLCR